MICPLLRWFITQLQVGVEPSPCPKPNLILRYSCTTQGPIQSISIHPINRVNQAIPRIWSSYFYNPSFQSGTQVSMLFLHTDKKCLWQIERGTGQLHCRPRWHQAGQPGSEKDRKCNRQRQCLCAGLDGYWNSCTYTPSHSEWCPPSSESIIGHSPINGDLYSCNKTFQQAEPLPCLLPKLKKIRLVQGYGDQEAIWGLRNWKGKDVHLDLQACSTHSCTIYTVSHMMRIRRDTWTEDVNWKAWRERVCKIVL